MKLTYQKNEQYDNHYVSSHCVTSEWNLSFGEHKKKVNLIRFLEQRTKEMQSYKGPK